MFIALDTLSGTLQAQFDKGSTLLPVDPAMAAALCSQIGNCSCIPGEEPADAPYTYLQISDGASVEIVKAVGCSGELVLVERQQACTSPATFPAGSCVRFVWTQEAITALLDNALRDCGIDCDDDGEGDSGGGGTSGPLPDYANFTVCPGLEYVDGHLCFDFARLPTESFNCESYQLMVFNGCDYIRVSMEDLCNFVNDACDGTSSTGTNGTTPRSLGLVEGKGVQIGGTAAAPEIALSPTGVTASNYGGAEINSCGQFTYIPPNWPNTSPALPDGTVCPAQITVTGGVITGVYEADDACLGVASLTQGSCVQITNDGQGHFTVGLSPTGVAAGDYGGITVDGCGRITGFAAGYANDQISASLPITLNTTTPGTTVIEHAPSPLASGTYAGFTVDQWGHVTAYDPECRPKTGRWAGQEDGSTSKSEGIEVVQGVGNVIEYGITCGFIDGDYHLIISDADGNSAGATVSGKTAGGFTVTYPGPGTYYISAIE